jgi:hypothetical protein
VSSLSSTLALFKIASCSACFTRALASTTASCKTKDSDINLDDSLSALASISSASFLAFF